MKPRITDRLRETIADKKLTFAEICLSLPEYEKLQISGALSSMVRHGDFTKEGPKNKRIYCKQSNSVKKVKDKFNPRIVRAYVGNVFSKPIGKVPHFLDPRRDYQEREQLAMMAR